MPPTPAGSTAHPEGESALPPEFRAALASIATIDARTSDALKRIGKMSERLKALEPARASEPASPHGNGHGNGGGIDPLAGIRFGRLLGRLPEAQASELEEALERGALTIKEAERSADMALRIAAGLQPKADTGGATPPKPPRGIGATPAASTPATPRSRAEYIRMIAAAKPGDEREALKATFADLDISTLPPW